jgi:hypothetical protein
MVVRLKMADYPADEKTKALQKTERKNIGKFQSYAPLHFI